LHPYSKQSFHNQPSVACAAENERFGAICASPLENVSTNQCSRYLNAYGEGRVLAGTRGPLREMHTQEEPHSSIQV
jgi:hypothetical protein